MLPYATSLIFLTILIVADAAFPPFDITQINKKGSTFSSASCNKDTVISFSFSSSSSFSCTSSACTTTSGGLSNLYYLDMNGNQKFYTLSKVEATNDIFLLTVSTSSFIFEFNSGTQFVYVVIPFTTTASIFSDALGQKTINLNSNTDLALNSLSSLTDGIFGSGITLTTFNFLNKMDYSHFYHIYDTASKSTVLVSSTTYYLPNAAPLTNIISATTLTSLTGILPAYSSTGDLLCWGSASEGLFQTHMRESIPLWFFWLSILLFWIYNLIGAEVTSEVYENSFKDNKWTCWSLYSIFYLSHEEFFTKTSRTALFYITTVWQGCVLAAIYSTEGSTSDKSIIIWSAVVAYLASIPLPYIFGHFFLQKIYATEIEKFDIQIHMKGLQDKKQWEERQKQMFHRSQRLYGLYYAYYLIIFVLLVIFTVVSVHQMQQTTRDFYYLHFYWLASIGITLGIDHLLIDPIITAIFGDTNFYRIRGYYYNGDLGEKAQLVD